MLRSACNYDVAHEQYKVAEYKVYIRGLVKGLARETKYNVNYIKKINNKSKFNSLQNK